MHFKAHFIGWLLVLFGAQLKAQYPKALWVVEPVCLSFTKASGEGVQNRSAKFMSAATFSGGLELRFAPFIGLRLMPGYSTRGSKFISTYEQEIGILTGEVKGRHRYSYYIFPALLTFYLGSSKSFYLNGGGYASYLHKQESILKKSETYPRMRLERERPFVTQWDYGVALGAGRTFKIGDRFRGIAGLRAEFGLGDVLDPVVWSAGPVRFDCFSLLFGLMPDFD